MLHNENLDIHRVSGITFIQYVLTWPAGLY